MNISQSNKEHLVDIITLTVESPDYLSEYEKELKEAAKKVELKGFRPGMAPMSMVRKRFGKDIVADIVYRKANDALFKYIEDENIVHFAKPLMVNGPEVMDPEVSKSFTFEFEVALLPEVNISNKGTAFNWYTIEVNEEVIEKELKWIANRYGKEIEAPTSETEDELTLSVGAKNFIVDVSDAQEAFRNQLIGLKPNDNITLNLFDILENPAENLELSEEEKDQYNNALEYTVNKITRFIPAILDEEFFAENFKDSPINNLTDLRSYIKMDITNNTQRDAKNILLDEIFDSIKNTNQIVLPESFLKQWILINDEKVKEENIDAVYENSKRAILWDVIETQILKSNDITVDINDVRAYIKTILAQNVALEEAIDDEEKETNDAQMNQLADSLLEDEKRFNEAWAATKNEKIFSTLQNTYSIVETPIAFENWIHIVKEKNALVNA